MSNTMGTWGKELACIWTNYLPPCRVSWSELEIYTKYLRKLQSEFNTRKLNLLILGSTSELRDWGHEEFLNVTVIDYSPEYNEEIAHQMKYKNISENFYNKKWQDIDCSEEFHIIVGDLVIGNLKEDEVPDFLSNIDKALKPGGFFITKSFFQKTEYKKAGIEKLFIDYLDNPPISGHPFSNLIYGIAMNCIEDGSSDLKFFDMYKCIRVLYDKKTIDKNLFHVFSSLGWQENMKFSFYFPPVEVWEDIATQNFKILSKEKSLDVYSNDFDIYVLKKLKG